MIARRDRTTTTAVEEIAARWGLSTAGGAAGDAASSAISALREAYSLGYAAGQSSARAPAKPPREVPGLAPVFAIRAFGELRVERNGTQLKLDNRRRSVSLLGFLIARCGKPATIDAINEALWPSAGTRSAANRLNIALHYLRGQLGLEPREPPIVRTRTSVVLELSDICLLDVAEFRKALEGSDIGAKRAALALYRGDLLGDFVWEDWSSAPRDELREEALALHKELAALAAAEGDAEAVAAHLRSAIGIDPYDEALYRQAIEVERKRGRHAAAARYEALLRDRLAEIDVAPRADEP